MPITRDFIYQRDVERDFFGFKPTWFDNADPTSGRGVAHDMLEHFRHQAGPVEGELEAFGAFLAIRLEQGAIYAIGSRSPTDVLAEDVRGLLVDMADLGLPVPAPKTSRRLNELHVWADDTLVDAVRRGMDLARREWASRREQGQQAPDAGQLLTDTLQATLVAWIRQGYRRALRRYDRLDLYQLGNAFFSKIGNKLEQLLDSEFLTEGDRIRISLHPRTARIGVRVNGICAQAAGYL